MGAIKKIVETADRGFVESNDEAERVASEGVTAGYAEWLTLTREQVLALLDGKILAGSFSGEYGICIEMEEIEKDEEGKAEKDERQVGRLSDPDLAQAYYAARLHDFQVRVKCLDGSRVPAEYVNALYNEIRRRGLHEKAGALEFPAFDAGGAFLIGDDSVAEIVASEGWLCDVGKTAAELIAWRDGLSEAERELQCERFYLL